MRVALIQVASPETEQLGERRERVGGPRIARDDYALSARTQSGWVRGLPPARPSCSQLVHQGQEHW